MARKIFTFVGEVIATSLIMAVVIWVINFIFDGQTTFDRGVLLQAFFFAIIYVPLAAWSPWRSK